MLDGRDLGQQLLRSGSVHKIPSNLVTLGQKNNTKSSRSTFLSCAPRLTATNFIRALGAAVVYTGTIHEFTALATPAGRSQIRFLSRETVFLLWRLRLFPAGQPSKSAARRAGRLGKIWTARFRFASDYWQSPALRPAGTGAGQVLRR